MRRRTVLSTIALLPLAGCLDSTRGGGGSTPTDTTTEMPTDTPTTTQPTTTPTDAEWETSFQLQSIECATEDAAGATVSFANSNVEVSGTALGADMCWIAQLDRVTYDEQSSELVIVVETMRQESEDTMCAQCIAGIDYAVTVTFSSGYPDAVEVVHAREGDEQTITRTTR